MVDHRRDRRLKQEELGYVLGNFSVFGPCNSRSECGGEGNQNDDRDGILCKKRLDQETEKCPF